MNLTGHNLCWMNSIQGSKKRRKTKRKHKKEGKLENYLLK